MEGDGWVCLIAALFVCLAVGTCASGQGCAQMERTAADGAMAVGLIIVFFVVMGWMFGD